MARVEAANSTLQQVSAVGAHAFELLVLLHQLQKHRPCHMLSVATLDIDRHLLPPLLLHNRLLLPHLFLHNFLLSSTLRSSPAKHASRYSLNLDSTALPEHLLTQATDACARRHTSRARLHGSSRSDVEVALANDVSCCHSNKHPEPALQSDCSLYPHYFPDAPQLAQPGVASANRTLHPHGCRTSESEDGQLFPMVACKRTPPIPLQHSRPPDTLQRNELPPVCSCRQQLPTVCAQLYSALHTRLGVL
jgi:hypothetical protein